MSEYVTLMGAEDVRSAASSIRSSAEQMSRSMSQLELALHNAILRYEEITQRHIDALAHRHEPRLSGETGPP